MASEVVEEGSCYEWSSYIRGYHDYQAVWTPTIEEMLLLKVEPTNPYDDFAVSIVKDGAVVGHVPKYVSRVICFFLKRVESVGFCEGPVVESIEELDWDWKFHALTSSMDARPILIDSKHSCCQQLMTVQLFPLMPDLLRNPQSCRLY